MTVVSISLRFTLAMSIALLLGACGDRSGAESAVAEQRLSGEADAAVEAKHLGHTGEAGTAPVLNRPELAKEALGHLQSNEYTEAVAAAEAYREANPGTAEPFVLLGHIFLATRREGKAVEAFTEARRLEPGNFNANDQLAKLALRQGDTSQARLLYKEILIYHENHLDSLLKLAKISALDKDEQAVVSYLQEAVHAHPTALEPRLVLGRYYQLTGSFEKVAPLLADLDEANRDRADVLQLMAASQAGLKDFRGARGNLERLTELDPDSAETRFTLARICAELKDQNCAREALEAAIQIDPKLDTARLALARLLLLQRDEAEVETHLMVLKQNLPEHPDIIQLESSLAMLQGDQERAMALSEKALERSGRTERMLVLARQKKNMGDEAGALQLLEQWAEEHPDDLLAQKSLADAYLQAGRTDDAVDFYKKVVEIDSDNINSLNNLAWYLKEKKPREALSYARRAAELQPQSPLIQDTLAMVLLQNGMLDEARSAIQRAETGSPLSATIKFHSALIAEAQGDFEMAQQKVEQALQGEGEIPERKQMLELLSRLEAGTVAEE